MLTLKEKIKCEYFYRRWNYLFTKGFYKRLIRSYFDLPGVMDRFRNTYYGGIPLSIQLLCRDLMNHKCYDKALLVAYAFHDNSEVSMIDADIDAISYNPATIEEYKNVLGYLPEHYGNHCFVEIKSDLGVTWVYDTTKGLIFEKNLYYFMEKPKITKINNKEAILANPEYQELLEQDFKHDISNSPLLIPNFERLAQVAIYNQDIYAKYLVKEIEMFKEKVNYEKIEEEYKLERKMRFNR